MKLIVYILGVFFLIACGNAKETTLTPVDANSLPAKPVKIQDASQGFSMTGDDAQQDSKPVGVKRSQENDSLVFSIRRTACFGTCPIYVAQVYKSGYAEYEGKNFVDNIGVFQARISLSAIEEVLAKAKEIDFYALNESYDNLGISDLPATIVIINNVTLSKQILNRYDGPKALISLEQLIDGIIEQQTWVEKK
jgi:hypothetical protein